MQLFLQFLPAMPVLKYVLLFVAVIIEGPLVTMGAGVLASLGYFNPIFSYFIICAADVASDSIYYGVAFWGRERLIKKFAPYANISIEKLRGIEHLIHRHSRKSIIIAKLTHFAGVPFLVAAGLARINFSRFLFYDAVATIPKSIVFLALGYYLGEITGTISNYLEYGTFIVSALVIIVFIVYIFLGKYLGEKFLNKKSQ